MAGRHFILNVELDLSILTIFYNIYDLIKNVINIINNYIMNEQFINVGQ